MAEDNSTGKFNHVVTWWKNNVRKNAISNVVTMTGKGVTGSYSNILSRKTYYKLESNITTKTRKDFGEINMVSFQFPRHGVFVHKGVGRGWEMISGKVVRTAKGIQKGTRVPKDWLNSEIDKSVGLLADELVTIKADAVVNAASAKIK
jgi:hypothetical protein